MVKVDGRSPDKERLFEPRAACEDEGIAGKRILQAREDYRIDETRKLIEKEYDYRRKRISSEKRKIRIRLK